jgi:hypothetical protein
MSINKNPSFKKSKEEKAKIKTKGMEFNRIKRLIVLKDTL